MNVLRNLARNLWNAIETRSAEREPQLGAKTLHAARQQRVPPVLGLSRFRDGFEQLPQGTFRALQPDRALRPSAVFPGALRRDGFELAARRPVDLLGGVKNVARPTSEPKSAAPAFTASLQDLAALL